MANDPPLTSGGAPSDVPAVWQELLRSEEPVAPASGPRPSPLANFTYALVRWKWVLVVTTLAGILGGYLLSLRVSAVYRAETTLWLESGGESSAAQGPIRSGDLLQSHTWIELLRSNAVLEPVVLERQLYLQVLPPAPTSAFATFSVGADLRPGAYSLQIDPSGEAFVLSARRDAAVLQRGRVGEPVGAALGFEWVPPPGAFAADQRIDFLVNQPRDVARALGENLDTRMAPDETFLRIAWSGTDPVHIAAVLNAITRHYVEVAAQLKRSKLDELSTVLQGQLSLAEQNLTEAEMELEAFRVSSITLPSEQGTPTAQGAPTARDPAFDAYFEMKIEREQERRDREALERIIGEIGAGNLAVDALAAVPRVQETTELSEALEQRAIMAGELRGLEQRYTDDYLPVRRLRDDLRQLEERTIPELALRLVDQLAARERDLDSRLGGAAVELEQIPPRVIEAARLERRVAIAENLFTTLKQRYEEARLAAESSIPDVRILDAATVPFWPVENRKLTMLILGVLGGVGSGLAGVFGLNQFDRKLRYPAQVVEDFGLSIVGAVPTIPARGRSVPERRRQLQEAIRELRLNVTNGIAFGQPIALTISSAASGDGKSFVAQHLARSFAAQGLRTLLIDADIRRGQLHHAFDAYRSPGLTDLFLGSPAAEDVVQKTAFPSLRFLGSGTRTEKGPELLASPELPNLVRALQATFPVIIVDSPPLGAGVDPYLLAMATGNLLLVVRTDRTNRNLLIEKMSLIHRLPVRVLGTVLNGIPSTGGYEYYSYLPGYHVEAEVEAEAVT